LRKTKPYAKVKDGVAFKTALARVSTEKVNAQKEYELKDDYLKRLNKIAHEEYLRDTALTNTFNHWALFKSDNSFADQFEAFRAEYGQAVHEGNSFMTDYNLVNDLSVGATALYTNLKLNDSSLEGDVLNVLHENLLALMNKDVTKVDNQVDNDDISDLFRKFTIVAFLQSGMNTKSAFSLTRLVPEDLYMRMLEGPVKDYVEHLDRADDSNKSSKEYVAAPILELFYKRFVSANEFKNRQGRIRGKQLNDEYGLAESIADLKGKKKQPTLILPYEPLAVAGTAHGLKGYVGSKLDTLKAIQDKTADKTKTFVYDLALENPNSTNTALGSRMYFDVPNSIGLPTLKKYSASKDPAQAIGRDGVITDVDGKIDPDIKIGIDDAITALKQARDAGQDLYFDIEGYGQYMVGYYKPLNKSDIAKQTFLYLSKQLLEEFNFINPGYLGTEVGMDTIQSVKVQPISDNLVLDFMKHCI
jgi:hypothetical protein